ARPPCGPTSIGRSFTGASPVFRSTTTIAEPCLPSTTAVRTTFTSRSVPRSSSGLRLASVRSKRTEIRLLESWVVAQPETVVARTTSEAAPSSQSELAEATADVLPRPVLAGLAEELLGAAVLDEVAEVHEPDVVGDAVGLLEVVRDDHDRHVL